MVLFLFALPLVQFVLVRWLWHWALWSYVLARLARLPLALDALHPDRAAGLKRSSASPVDAFAMFIGAIMSMVAASWWERIHAGEDTLQSLSPQWLIFFVVAVVVACGPLLLFSRQLYRARHRDATAYHVLAREYAEAFRTKWLAPHPGEEVLGTSDIQSLSDLDNSYRAAEDTRIYLFDARTLIYLAVGAVAPIHTVALATSPITEVATHPREDAVRCCGLTRYHAPARGVLAGSSPPLAAGDRPALGLHGAARAPDLDPGDPAGLVPVDDRRPGARLYVPARGIRCACPHARSGATPSSAR